MTAAGVASRMDDLRPQLEPHVTIEPVDEAGADPGLHRVRPPEGGSVATLPDSVVSVLLLFDGKRTCADVEAEVAGWGVSLPAGGFVATLAHSLAVAGIVRVLGRQLSVSGKHGYSCLQCGASCSGPEIGPLTDSAAERIVQQWRELSRETPALARDEPVRWDDRGRGYLTRPRGRCVFLTDDNRCRIHHQFGFEAKPLACRLFPVVATVDGDSVRLGLSGSCMRMHRTYDANEPFDLKGKFGAFPGVRPLARSVRAPAGGKKVDAEALEERLLHLLSVEELDLAQLVSLAVTDGTGPGAPAVFPEVIAHDLRQLVEAWAGAIASGASWPTSLEPAGLYGRTLQAVAETVAGSARASGELQALPPRWRRFLAYRVRGYVWLREGHRHGTLREGLVILAVGCAAALWFAAALRDSDAEARFDRFGEALAVWALATQGAGERILSDERRVALGARWRAALTPA